MEVNVKPGNYYMDDHKMTRDVLDVEQRLSNSLINEK